VIASNLFRTSTFRLSIIYLVLFGLSVIAVLGFVYWQTAGFIARQTDQAIEAEIDSLAETYQARGLGAMQRLVERRAANQKQSLYVIADPNLNPIAGNLDSWPATTRGGRKGGFLAQLWPENRTNEAGWVEFNFERTIGELSEVHEARARHLVTDQGFHILVGRDVHERRAFEDRLRESLLWTIGLVLALGLFGGTVMSRNMLNRIDGINRVSRDIMLGDLSQRVPVAGNADELDRLALNLNAMLDQIERLMTGMREVTDNVAHDLRSPLNRLRSRLEVTLMEPPSVAAYREALEATVNEAEGLLHTFNALLSIAQAEAGVRREDLADLDVATVTRDAAELYEPAAEDKGLAFSVKAEDGLTIRGNRHLLSQALANLLDNAIKYTPNGGAVTVTAKKAGAAAELVVTDTGPGITEPDRERVLDRFVRLESSRNKPGSGLGLSLVRAVAKHHGAALALDDNHPGLRVTLRFPNPQPALS
jgi:signal transduction histidine kinase